MITDQRIKEFLLDLESRGMSANTLRAYRADLTGLMTFQCNLTGASFEQEAASYLNLGRKEWSPKTTCRKLTTFRTYGHWLGFPAFLATYKPPTPSKSLPHPIPEGIAGVEAMIASTKNPLHKALLAMNGLLGLRVDECINIKPEHFNLTEMTLTVKGKGDKTRVIPLSLKAWGLLEPQYTAMVPANGRLVPYSNRGARKAVSRHGVRAGLSRHVASHDLRATMLTAAYRNSLNIRAVADLAGHASVNTTMGYTGVTMDEMRSAADL
jgi:site-specific recombinase XerD